ncbi:MAG: intradiol ring-cleavage dioxygenase [Solirubrobacteraceae bacterium]|nr:intradiol ring-cleavage dioxygenase [Solirubrobacteraceae bacterium]
MDQDVLASRAAVSRRRLLAVGGSIGIGTLLAACGDSADGGSATVTTNEGTTATIEPTTPAATTSSGTSAGASNDLVALLDEANTCSLAKEQTQGPYWFDVDSIRSDITEDRPGTELQLALRVVDAGNCDADGTPATVDNAVVEIWHCDAGGSYSGFESGSSGQGGGPPGGGESGGTTSDGEYSEGVQEATPTDDSTYLRGAQVTDKDGIAKFTTIYPGWYRGRTVHIHLKVHVNKKNVLTTQLYFDEELNSKVFDTAPYSSRTGRDTFNDGDSIYDASGLVTAKADGDAYIAAINLGIDA